MAKDAVLAEICEPIFQYICRLNRMGRKGGRTDQALVKTELKEQFELARRGAEQAQLLPAYLKAELVLIFFVDSMILNSKLTFTGGWKAMSHDRAELAFEEKFWDILEDHLRDPSDDSTQVLTVFYVCIGLGFTGLLTGQHAALRQKMLEISSRLRGMINADWAGRMCGEAYENVDRRELSLPRSRSVVALAIAVVILAAIAVAANVVMFKTASGKLRAALVKITSYHEGTAQAPVAPVAPGKEPGK